MKYIKYLILAAVSVLVLVFVFNDHFLYDSVIVKVGPIESGEPIGTGEKYIQTITGRIENGPYKGELITFENTTSKSGVFDEQLHGGSEVFVTLSEDGKEVLSVNGVKRDKYIAVLAVIFVWAALLVGKSRGRRSLISMALNMLVAGLVIWVYIKGHLGTGILPMFMVASVVFITSSLLICNGRSRKTTAAVISSLISMTLSFLLAYIVISIHGSSISYWNMDYIDALHQDYRGIFYLNILLSGLGAIMDISITMASSLNELKEKDPHITRAALHNSGRMISRDIMGTMTNVMLFTCFISVIPITVLAVRNWMTVSEAIASYGEIEMIRTLTSCIGIVISVPVSLYVSLWIFGKEASDG